MDQKRLLKGLAIATVVGLFLAIFVYHEFRIASTPAPMVI